MQKEFLGLRTVIYKVADLDSAKKWYSEAFHSAPYFDMPFYVGYTIAGYELGLQAAQPNDIPSQNVEVYWGVANVQASYDRLIKLGATPHNPPQDVGGEIIVATVKDPWNNIIGIIYNPTFKLDQ